LNLRLHPYQQNTGNRCAHGRFRRSRSTVEAAVKCSHRVQLNALITRLDPAIVEGILSLSRIASRRHRRLPATMPSIMLPHRLHQHPPLSVRSTINGSIKESARAVWRSLVGLFSPSITNVVPRDEQHFRVRAMAGRPPWKDWPARDGGPFINAPAFQLSPPCPAKASYRQLASETLSAWRILPGLAHPGGRGAPLPTSLVPPVRSMLHNDQEIRRHRTQARLVVQPAPIT
jgi:hypothetical protein